MRRHAGRCESEVDRIEIPQRHDQHQRAGDQSQRQGELRDREAGADPSCAGDRSPSGIARCACRLVPGAIQGRHEAGCQAASNRHAQRHRQHARIERDGEVRSRRDRRQEERRDELLEPHCERDAERATAGREQHRLGELQQQETTRAGAERQPHRVFASPADAANHQEVRHVRAPEQQQRSPHGQEHRHKPLIAFPLQEGGAEPFG
jgi:hypothetical protein